jgi:hypothetical protein
LKLKNYQYTWANDKPDSLYNILAMVRRPCCGGRSCTFLGATRLIRNYGQNINNICSISACYKEKEAESNNELRKRYFLKLIMLQSSWVNPTGWA